MVKTMVAKTISKPKYSLLYIIYPFGCEVSPGSPIHGDLLSDGMYPYFHIVAAVVFSPMKVE